jgi:hypothetical protein
MRRATICSFMVVAVLAVISLWNAPAGVGAQDSSSNAMGHGFVGTWQVAQIVAGKPAGIRLATWFSDGTIITSGPTISPAPAGAPNKFVYNSMAQGTWYPTSDTAATATFSWLRSDENGTFLGMTTIRLNSTLSADGQSFHNVAEVVITDPSGAVVSTIPGNGDGIRLSAQGPDPSIATPAA